MTSLFHDGTLFRFFEFCQLWRSIIGENFIFIKKLGIMFNNFLLPEY